MGFVTQLTASQAVTRIEELTKKSVATAPLEAEEFSEFLRLVDGTGFNSSITIPEVKEMITLDLLAALMVYKAKFPGQKFKVYPSGDSEFGFDDLSAPKVGLNIGPPTTGRWNTVAPGAAGWAAHFVAFVFPTAPAAAYALITGVENQGVDTASRYRIFFETTVKVLDIRDLVNRPDQRKYFPRPLFGGNGTTLTTRIQYHTNAASEYRLLGYYIANGTMLALED